MNNFLRRYQKAIFGATLAVFFGGMFVGFGGYWFTSRDMQGVVARVGTTKIMYSELMARADRYAAHLRDQGADFDDSKMTQLKRDMLNGLMVDELLAVKAESMGIVVTDEELARDIRANPEFVRSGQFDQNLYFQTVRLEYRMSPQDYEQERRKSLKSTRLKGLFFRTSKVTAAEVKETYAVVNKGNMKKFDKEKNDFATRMQQQRALGLINDCLRQMQNQVETQNLLPNFETGA